MSTKPNAQLHIFPAYNKMTHIGGHSRFLMGEMPRRTNHLLSTHELNLNKFKHIEYITSGGIQGDISHYSVGIVC